ncbi:aspartic peptidase domain-containing protein [Lactarius sanguifluus]|nr:aspartic peptidase domain-containing protein [Lactarius sanguifluus]
MILFFIFCIPFLVFWPSSILALPVDPSTRGEFVQKKRGFELPIQRRVVRSGSSLKRGTYSGSTGLGDSLDLFYTVAVTIGETVTAVNVDTGSSDLWVVSSACTTSVCESTNMPPYPSANIKPAGGSVNLLYGDSSTGTHASGPVAQDTATVAGLAIPQQPFAAISDTNNTSVMQGANGIFGLGFPSGSQVQTAIINAKFNNPPTTDDFVLGTASDGPFLSRLAMSGALEQPMFTVILQLRLYKSEDGGLSPPTFAPNEVLPLDGIVLDGQRLPASKLTGSSPTLSALLDTGNSVIRGPQDVVNSVLKSVSSAFTANSNAAPTFPCKVPHTLAFQIGGKTFPVDPRDFISQHKIGDVSTCVANNLVATDPPQSGALFSWSLGDPFFKSNLVAFYYGNLTHPSADPPRIGFLSMVPDNANVLLQNDIAQAEANGGNFESTSQIAPTNVTSTIWVTPTTVPSPPPRSTSPPSPANASLSGSSRNSASAGVLYTILIPALFGTFFAFF